MVSESTRYIFWDRASSNRSIKKYGEILLLPISSCHLVYLNAKFKPTSRNLSYLLTSSACKEKANYNIYARLRLTKIIFFRGLIKCLAHNHPPITTILQKSRNFITYKTDWAGLNLWVTNFSRSFRISSFLPFP